MTTTTRTLTVDDIEAGYRNDGWLGFGYLGGRQTARESIASGEWTVDNIDDADTLALLIANEKGWSPEQFFDWLNSKPGRWFSDVMLGGEVSEADRVVASRYVALVR